LLKPLNILNYNDLSQKKTGVFIFLEIMIEPQSGNSKIKTFNFCTFKFKGAVV